MAYEPPKPVELTPSEARLWSLVRPHSDLRARVDGDWSVVADAAESLTMALLKRDAIPRVRLDLFRDPQLAETGSRSREQVFEGNGTQGREVWRHPHFPPYLKHFIEGPDLPLEAIDGLCRILNEDRGTSGMVMDQYRAFARACVRRHGLEKKKAATEFYRLGIEIGMERSDARTLRDAASTAR